MEIEKTKVAIIGFNSKAPGGFRAALDMFSTYLPMHDIDLTLIGFTKGSPRGSGKYVPILTCLSSSLIMSTLGLLVKAPFLPIRQGAVIMTAYSVMQLPFIIFYPRHPKVMRLAQRTDAISINKSGFLMSLYGLVERICVPFMTGFIALDKYTEKYLKERYGITDDKIFVIPVAPDLNLFQPLEKARAREEMRIPSNHEMVLYAGKLTEVKNIEMLLTAFMKLKSVRENVLLVIAGTGPCEDKLKKYAREHGIEDVSFLGYIDHDKMPVLLNCADVFVLPSLSEVSPNVVKEALACGLPVVSTAVGDVPEYVRDGYNGYIAKTEATDFMRGLKQALENNDELRKNARFDNSIGSAASAMALYASFFRQISES